MRPWVWSSVLLAPPPSHAPAEKRRRVLQAVQQYPGLGAADIARQAGASLQLAEYHLHALTKSGLVASRDDTGHATYFSAGEADTSPVDRRDRGLVTALRRPMALRMALQLLETGSMPMGELAEACGVSPATATHHIKRLQQADVVRIDQEGRRRKARLADADRLRDVLIHHPPPHDVVAGFIELWDRVDV